jgi:hypothetical protein
MVPLTTRKKTQQMEPRSQNCSRVEALAARKKIDNPKIANSSSHPGRSITMAALEYRSRQLRCPDCIVKDTSQIRKEVTEATEDFL